ERAWNSRAARRSEGADVIDGTPPTYQSFLIRQLPGTSAGHLGSADRVVEGEGAARRPLVMQLQAGAGAEAAPTGAGADLARVDGGFAGPQRVVGCLGFGIFPAIPRHQAAGEIHQ